MKKKVISSVLLLLVFLCSCERDVTVTTETEAQTSVESTIMPENVTHRTHQTSVQETFDIHSVESDITFDDILDVIVMYYGVAYYNPYDDEQDVDMENKVRYVTNPEDIVAYWETVAEGFTDIIPSEIYYETREFEYDRRGVLCYEFSSSEWAVNVFENKLAISVNSYNEDGIVCNHSEEGFCICYSNNGSFCAQYLINNMYFSIGFRLENVGNNGYTEYLEICNLLGLPTSNEITEAVLA